MYCYKCGCELTNADTCPNCGADVRQYREIIYTSNYLYNQGLEKAGVRDLSGAILCLKQALVYNKDNLDARNLLGLVYFEIGETVAAISEWVISKNLNDSRLHQKHNLAESYLNQVQNDRQVMENISSSIQRYNHALECCYSDNLDVAMLQLRKVISVNPHYLRARQLLALLLIRQQDWRKAERELQKCLRLDINNTDTLRYLKEVEERLQQSQEGETLRKRTASARENTVRSKSSGKNRSAAAQQGGVIKYKADNETIIQPVGGGMPGIDGFRIPGWIYGLVIGVIAGAAAVAFLVMPSRVQSVRTTAAEQVRSLSEQVGSQQDQIDSLTSQLADTESTESAEETTESGDESTDTVQKAQDALLASANQWVAVTDLADSADTTDLTDSFAALDPSTAKDGQDDAFGTLYDSLYAKLQSPMLERFAWDGINEYEKDSPDYATVVTDLEIANRFEDPDNLSMTYVERLWYLGDSYYRVYTAASDGDKKGVCADYLTKARTCLETVTTDYPDSEYASNCESRLLDIATNANLTNADAASTGTSSAAGTGTSGSSSSSTAASTSASRSTAASSTTAASTTAASTTNSAAAASTTTTKTAAPAASSDANAGTAAADANTPAVSVQDPTAADQTAADQTAADQTAADQAAADAAAQAAAAAAANAAAGQ